MAKIFGEKFTLISPVWLQISRIDVGLYEIPTHDVDKGWMKAVKKANSANHTIKSESEIAFIVILSSSIISISFPVLPRVMFEQWTHSDIKSLLTNSQEKNQLVKTLVDTAKVTFHISLKQSSLKWVLDHSKTCPESGNTLKFN